MSGMHAGERKRERERGEREREKKLRNDLERPLTIDFQHSTNMGDHRAIWSDELHHHDDQQCSYRERERVFADGYPRGLGIDIYHTLLGTN